MVKALQNNVRLWHNNGHTDKELIELGYSVSTGTSPDRDSSQRKKLGRNDPCHCGSGKKYKKCCLVKDEKMKTNM
ncbi:MAG: SEC-C domain-containing protein [Alkalibacterium sp.]|nr:SEC-C domain-containing protein [Alkalibacterium sp.]